MKLTQERKGWIVNTAISEIFQKREEGIENEEDQLAMEVYNLLYDDKTQRLVAQMPDGWLEKGKRVYVEIAGSDHGIVQLTMKDRKPMPISQVRNWKEPRLSLLNKPEIEQKVNILESRKNELREDRNSASKKLRDFLAGITTWKRLQEEWPEGREYYMKHYPAEATKHVPAISGSEIQKMLENFSNTGKKR